MKTGLPAYCPLCELSLSSFPAKYPAMHAHDCAVLLENLFFIPAGYPIYMYKNMTHPDRNKQVWSSFFLFIFILYSNRFQAKFKIIFIVLASKTY